MLPYKKYGSGQIALVMMPFLGGSQREWTEVANRLGDSFTCITVDLPGFGAASAVPGYSVKEMAEAVVDVLSSLNLRKYVLVGHSMAGKIAAVVARNLINDRSLGVPPAGLVLVAPSPPGPEPMSEAKRSEMLETLGRDSQLSLGMYTVSDRPAAEKFVHNNIAAPVSEGVINRTVDDVLAANPKAWVNWLEHGSKEDWASVVGILNLPTLILAGTQDQALGPDAQRTHTMPHFSHAELIEIDCSHLIPLEKPAELASLVSAFLQNSGIAGAL